MTKRTQLFLAALVLVAILAHAYLYWWAHTSDHGYWDTLPFVKETSDSLSGAYPLANAPKPVTPGAEKPSQNTTAMQWRTYEDTEMKFNFLYPETWSVARTELAGKTTYCLNITNTTGGCLITLTAEKESQNASQDIALKAYNSEFRDQTVKTSDKKIAGEEAKLLTASAPKEEGGLTRAAVFVHDMTVYTIDGVRGNETVFDKVVSTLKFY